MNWHPSCVDGVPVRGLNGLKASVLEEGQGSGQSSGTGERHEYKSRPTLRAWDREVGERELQPSLCSLANAHFLRPQIWKGAARSPGSRAQASQLTAQLSFHYSIQKAIDPSVLGHLSYISIPASNATYCPPKHILVHLSTRKGEG